MQKHLPACILLFIIFSSCASSLNRSADTGKNNNSRNLPAVSSGFQDVDTSFIMRPELPDGLSPVSLMELPRTEEGAFVLSPGLYEADFKTYCLQPGTPGPSSQDVYFQAPLEGSRKDMIRTILLNSREESQLDQKNIQLLLWSVVSHSDFQKLSPEVQNTAVQLLSPKQLFQLQGGVVGVVKTVASIVPSTGGQGDVRKLFDLGVSSYEAYERLAVVNTPSRLSRNDIKQDQWYRQEEGYYVRFLPYSYQKTRIQVYMPGNRTDSSAYDPENYIVFDPASRVVVPANSNAQRLGIGGPVVDIVRSVIRNMGSGKGAPRPKQPKTRTPEVKK